MTSDIINPDFDPVSRFNNKVTNENKTKASIPTVRSETGRENKNIQKTGQRELDEFQNKLEEQQLQKMKAADQAGMAEKTAKPDQSKQPEKPDQRLPEPRTAPELQAMTEKIKAAMEQEKTRKELHAVEKEITKTRQALQEAAAEKSEYAWEMTSKGMGEVSYWDKLELVEKTRKINQLKEKVTELEQDRRAYVQELKNQVQDGSYQVTGMEVLQGMMEEYL